MRERRQGIPRTGTLSRRELCPRCREGLSGAGPLPGPAGFPPAFPFSLIRSRRDSTVPEIASTRSATGTSRQATRVERGNNKFPVRPPAGSGRHRTRFPRRSPRAAWQRLPHRQRARLPPRTLHNRDLLDRQRSPSGSIRASTYLRFSRERWRADTHFRSPSRGSLPVVITRSTPASAACTPVSSIPKSEHRPVTSRTARIPRTERAELEIVSGKLKAPFEYHNVKVAVDRFLPHVTPAEDDRGKVDINGRIIVGCDLCRHVVERVFCQPA